MPFALAHLALASPLDRILDGRLPVLALAVGTIAPDLELIARGRLGPTIGHETYGVVLLDLPLGLLLLIALGTLIIPAVVALLPDRLLHLGPSLQRHLTLPARTWLAPARMSRVVVAILLGAFSHLLWDDVTTRPPADVAVLGWLDAFPFTVASTELALHSVLHLVSTVAGLAVTAIVFTRWLRRQPREVPAAVLLEPTPVRARIAAWALVGITTAAFAIQNPFALIGDGPTRPESLDRLSTVIALWAIAGALCALTAVGVVVRTIPLVRRLRPARGTGRPAG